MFVKYRAVSNPALTSGDFIENILAAKAVYPSSSTCAVCRGARREPLTHHYSRPVFYGTADVLPSVLNCACGRINCPVFIKRFKFDGMKLK